MQYDILHDYDFTLSHLGFVTERKAESDWTVNVTNRDYYISALCLSGKADYHFDDKDYTVEQGDLLFFPKGVSHRASTQRDNPWCFISVGFDLEFYDKLCEKKVDRLPKLTRPKNYTHLSSLLSELSRLWLGKRQGYRIRCRSILMEILFLMINSAEEVKTHSIPHQFQINNVVNSLEKSSKEFLSLQQMAEMSHLSTSYFRLLFKEITGYSPIQYQNRVKVYKAKDMILAGEGNVSEAAYAVGFEDIYYFSRLFKKVIGVNPSEFVSY